MAAFGALAGTLGTVAFGTETLGTATLGVITRGFLTEVCPIPDPLCRPMIIFLS